MRKTLEELYREAWKKSVECEHFESKELWTELRMRLNDALEVRRELECWEGYLSESNLDDKSKKASSEA